VARKLYGISGSRALRAIWGIEETGVEYEHVSQHFRDAKSNPEYTAINPNGRIPALVDGDLVLFESMAINLYLAKAYGGDLYPRDAAGEAKAWQWSVWAISEIEPLQMQIVIQKLFVPADRRDQSVIDNAAKGLDRPLRVLDAELAKRPYLLGDDFTVADLNVAAVMLLLDMVQQDYSQYANVKRWMMACQARPALARARAKA
jgi:glutathione S-transferase